jgi:hypothetical protein
MNSNFKSSTSFSDNLSEKNEQDEALNGDEFATGANFRILQKQSATVRISNDCIYGVHVWVNYTTSNGNVSKETFIHSEGRLRLFGVTNPTIYIYGRNDNDVVVWSGQSNICVYGIGGTSCFRKVNLGSLASGFVVYRPCGQIMQLSPGTSWLPANAPMPLPIPATTPSPTPLPIPPPTPSPTPSPIPPPTPSSFAPPSFTPVANAGADLTSDWLTAHNSRRTTFYQQNGLGPKDLKWSQSLASSAQSYAELLTTLSDCTIEHGYDGNHYGGENLACNWGDDVSLTPEGVMQLWFDDEQNLPFGENLHYYQVAWRGTSYVGCGIANKTLSDGAMCFIQTCRYIAPGNCNVDANNILYQALQDTSPCTPECPTEGCF